ncbi:alpha/beta hydrolase [Salicibibacter cibarius]|uniref:Alpha/beta hydrolase n=1 Tax=Salicibibacter cibarius TaxID=2743000 RepID=A0A7T6Z6I5_9BACI|nr:alpha/beta hydrolase [Salicibibacter cibarius]QQK77785.1 alpha/beta hydrolase [Salicibibacter cibarius]
MFNETKPTFLFIHGSGGTARKWRMQRESLNKIRSTFIDLPGHGENKDQLKTTIESCADWVAEKIDEEVIVVGHSMGGLIGIELAARNSKVKGLVLVACHYKLPVNPKVLEKLSKGVFPESFFYAAYSKQVDPSLIAEEKGEIKINAVGVRKTDLEACDRYTKGKDIVSTLNIPMFAVYGSEDKMIPKDANQKLEALNPKIKTKVITNSGHNVMLEQPKLFNEMIISFRKKK